MFSYIRHPDSAHSATVEERYQFSITNLEIKLINVLPNEDWTEIFLFPHHRIRSFRMSDLVLFKQLGDNLKVGAFQTENAQIHLNYLL